MAGRNGFRTLSCVVALAVLPSAGFAAPAAQKKPALRHTIDPAKSKKSSKESAKLPAKRLTSAIPLPRKRPGNRDMASAAFAQAGAAMRGNLIHARAVFRPMARPTSGPFAVASSTTTSPADIAAVKRIIDLASKGKDAEINAAMASINDPVARKLAEWVYLRSFNTNPSFARFAAFIAQNPAWPHVPLFRRRAENALWDDRVDDATIRNFFQDHEIGRASCRERL